MSLPNCCKNPSLKTLRVIDESPDGEIVIFRCEACETYWRVNGSERMTMEEEDRLIESFDRLTADQAIELMKA